MAARNAVARRLSAVETLGSVTLLATDKTGTLTEGSMRVERLVPAPSTDRRELLAAGCLCNDAHLGEHSAVGDPTEVAILEAALGEGLDVRALVRDHARVAELPFDSVRKRMTTVHDMDSAGAYVVCKGAPEHVLAVVTPPDADARELLDAAEAMARHGLRVLAVAAAHRDLPVLLEDAEHGLQPPHVGLPLP
jgi:Ca2+-transporting ATPase